MKKYLLKSFALLAMLFSAITMSAISYCGETITATDGTTAVITCTQPTAGTYVMTVTSAQTGFGGLKAAKNYIKLDDTRQYLSNTNSSAKHTCTWDNQSKTLTIEFRCTNVPVMDTPLYLNFSTQEKEFDVVNGQVFDWPTSCEAGEEPNPTPEPETPSVVYCDFPTGHEGNANYGDANGRILVSLVKKSETEVRLVVKSADAATKNLDLLYVEAAGANPKATTVGSDVVESDLREMSVDITYPTAPAKYTFMIQWSHPDWTGRWQTNLNDITVEQLCTEGGNEGEGGETPGEGGEGPLVPELEPSTYCQTPLTVGTNTIYLTTEKVSDGNYRMTVEGENLSGFGGTFYNPGAKDLRDAITSQTSTKIICDIAAASAPIFYTPLYVNMPGEVTFSDLNGQSIVWGKCEVSDLAYSDLAIVSPSTLSHSLAIGETFTIGLSTSSTGAITYTSSNTDVAEVSASGVITAKAAGTTTITVSQAEDANYQAGEKSFTLDVIAAAVPSNKGFGTFQGRLDLYNIVDGYAGTDACGQVDLYVVTWGNDMLYKAKLVNNQFIDNGTGWRCQLRTKNAELSDGVRETWAIAATEDGTTRYTLYGNLNNTQGLNGYGETFKVYSYMTVKNCAPDERTIETLTYTRDHINNPIADNIAPILSGAANVTSTAENVTIALPAVTSEEVFYMIKDEAHNKQYISITPSFVLPQDGLGITYTYSCYAVDFNGNMSDPLTAEVSMAFNATSNLALNKPCQAGNEEGTNIASNANDGKNNSLWASGIIDVTNIWWYVDLGESYNLSTIEISWEGACATNYVIKGSDEYIAPTNVSAWESATTLVHQTEAPTTGENTQIIHNVTSNHARYLRLQANSLSHNGAYGGKIYEFRVFGTGVYDPSAAADTEKPVITSATPKEPIAHNEVQITMEASDNVGVVAYEVSGSGVSATCVAVDNVITVSNLQEQTTYNLNIVAVDAVGNKSDAYAMEAFTTGVNPYIPHESAPVPTRNAEDVLAFYSDAYTPVINLWGKNQWAGVNFSENNIAGNKYLHYAGNITNLGWEYNVNAGYTDGEHTGVNCSEMKYLHIDIWGYAAGSIRVIPIYGGTGLQHNEGYYTDVEILAGQWNSVDIALDDFEGNAHDFSSIYQFKFTNCNNTIAIDNVYFWKPAGNLPVESVTLDKTTATIEVEEALQLKATVLPMDAGNKNIIWTSSDETVATVVDGKVTGLKEGTTTITATSEDNDDIKATCAITVETITVKTWWGGFKTFTIEGQEYNVLYSFTRNEDKTITYSVLFDKDASKLGVTQVEANGLHNLGGYDNINKTYSWTSETKHNKNEVITGYFYFGIVLDFNFSYIVGSSNERPSTAVTSVTLDKTTCDLLAGETTQLSATVNPGYADNKATSWTSNAESVATVDANGLVTAKAEGTAIITVTTADGGKTAQCVITVSTPQVRTWWGTGEVTINGHDVDIIYSITHNLDKTLTYTVIFGDDTDMVREVNARSVEDVYHQLTGYDNVNKTASYTSTTTHSSGEEIIGFFWLGANAVNFTYVVGSLNERPSLVVESVALNHTSYNLLVNETVQLSATITPGTATNKSVTWSSDNNAVATVDENGLVTAKAEGTAIITVTTADGGKTATCTINVIATLTDVTYHASTSVKKDAAAYLGINYSITRTSDRTLRYVIKVNNSEYVDLEFNVVVNDNWQRMTYDASTNTYTYTTITTYADGDVVSGFFRQIKYGVEGRWDFNYVVGSTSTTPRTMVAFNDEDVDLSHLNNGSVYDVILKRNLVMDEDWNTLCLPFALTEEQVVDIFGEGTILVKLEESKLSSATEINLVFVPVTYIEASTPYLIKPVKNVDAGIALEGVVINLTPNVIETDDANMIPVLKAQSFTGENNTFYLGANENLYPRPTSREIKAMRAYFQFPNLTAAQASKLRARVVVEENVETALDNVSGQKQENIKVISNGQLIIIHDGGKYNAQGVKISE